MSRITALFSFILVWAAAVVAQEPSGSKELAKVVDRLASAKSLTADFTLADGGNQVNGRVVLAGRCFHITAAGDSFQTWFDGKTQWTWTAESGEVAMTEPTAAEILESNPLAVLESATDRFDSKTVSTTADYTSLRLTPKKGTKVNIQWAELKISRSTNFPVDLLVKLEGGGTLNITLKNVKEGDKINARDFRYVPSYHPDAEIIDLR